MAEESMWRGEEQVVRQPFHPNDRVKIVDPGTWMHGRLGLVLDAGLGKRRSQDREPGVRVKVDGSPDGTGACIVFLPPQRLVHLVEEPSGREGEGRGESGLKG